MLQEIKALEGECDITLKGIIFRSNSLEKKKKQQRCEKKQKEKWHKN